MHILSCTLFLHGCFGNKTAMFWFYDLDSFIHFIGVVWLYISSFVHDKDERSQFCHLNKKWMKAAAVFVLQMFAYLPRVLHDIFLSFSLFICGSHVSCCLAWSYDFVLVEKFWNPHLRWSRRQLWVAESLAAFFFLSFFCYWSDQICVLDFVFIRFGVVVSLVRRFV